MKVRCRSSYLPVLCSLSAICFAFPSFEVGGTCLRPREYFKAILWVTIILQLGQCFVRTKKYVVFLLIHVIFLSFQSAYIKCCIKFLILSSLPNSKYRYYSRFIFYEATTSWREANFSAMAHDIASWDHNQKFLNVSYVFLQSLLLAVADGKNIVIRQVYNEDDT